MTEHMQQEPEYIIAESDLGTIWDMLCSSSVMEEIYERVLSHPHNPAPDADTLQRCKTCGAWYSTTEHDAAVRKEALAPIVAYLNKHLEEENTKIRLSNEVGNADAGNRAGDIWAAYYGTLIQIPESLRKEVSCEQDGG